MDTVIFGGCSVLSDITDFIRMADNIYDAQIIHLIWMLQDQWFWIRAIPFHFP